MPRAFDFSAISTTVIIPAFRPAPILVTITADLLERGHQVVVVDNGSGDAPAYRSVFEALDPRVTVIPFASDVGKGTAIKTALRFIREREEPAAYRTSRLLATDEAFIHPYFVGIMDADGQYRPDDMDRVFEGAIKYPDRLCLGSRNSNRKMSLHARFGNATSRTVFHLLSGTKLSDTQTGLRACSSRLIPQMLRVEGERYEYETNVLACLATTRHRFVEVPITIPHDEAPRHNTHFRIVRDSVRILGGLFRFAGTSFVSFLVDYGCFMLLSLTFRRLDLAWADLIANIGARMVSGTLNYFLNCRLIFKTRPTFRTARRYILLASCILAVNSSVLYLWKRTPFPIALCKLLTECCMFLVNFTIQHLLVFRRKVKK